jgi:multiple sugar transport system permease protein
VDYHPTLDAWVYIFFDTSDFPFHRFLNSVIVALVSTTATIFLGGLAVYGLTRFQQELPRWAIVLGLVAAGFLAGALALDTIGLWSMPGAAAAMALLFAIWFGRYGRARVTGSGIMVAILATRILPPVVLVLPIYLMARYTGTLDTRFAVIITYTATNLPVAVWLLRSVLGVTPSELEEAAQIDGASHFRIFFDIVVPIAARGFAAAAVLIFILCWNEYLFSVYLTDDQAITMPPFLAAQMSVREQQAGAEAEEWARLSAAIVLMVAPLILAAGITQSLIARSALRRG